MPDNSTSVCVIERPGNKEVELENNAETAREIPEYSCRRSASMHGIVEE